MALFDGLQGRSADPSFAGSWHATTHSDPASRFHETIQPSCTLAQAGGSKCHQTGCSRHWQRTS
eukprot:10666945-Prorocentrum_lima.AAC.1